MTKPSIVISYRFTRPDTTGVHCQAALNEYVGKSSVTFIDPDTFDRHTVTPKADILLAIDDDREWIFPDDWPGKKAIWFIDTHTNFDKRVKRAPHFDYVFCAQLRGVRGMRERGINAMWLPLACNPQQHRRVRAKNEYDWCFVGNAPRDRWLPKDRAERLDILKARWPRHFAGNAYFDMMMHIYSASTVVWNRSIIDDLNMRVFEACASGTPLVTNVVEGQDRLFGDEHIIVYEGTMEKDEGTRLTEVMEWLLSGDKGTVAALRQTGKEAREHVYRYHTYKHRMQELLHIVAGYGNLDGIMMHDTSPDRKRVAS